MRKIIESTLVSLDGVIGDPHLWAMNYFDNEAQDDALELLLASDAMLMGRRTYEIFAGVWPARTGYYADRMDSIRKYVFSSTLERADWLSLSTSSIDTGRAANWAEGARPLSRRRGVYIFDGSDDPGVGTKKQNRYLFY